MVTPALCVEANVTSSQGLLPAGTGASGPAAVILTAASGKPHDQGRLFGSGPAVVATIRATPDPAMDVFQQVGRQGVEP